MEYSPIRQDAEVVGGMRGRISEALARGSIMRQSAIIFRSIGVLVLLLGLAAALGFVRSEQRATKLSELTNVAFLTSGMSRSVTASKDNMGAYRARNYDPEYITLSINDAKRAQKLNRDLRAAAEQVEPQWLPVVTQLDKDLAGVERIMEEIRDAPRTLVEEESFLGPRYDAIDAANAKIVKLNDDAASRVGEFSEYGLRELQIAIVAMLVFAAGALGSVVWGQRFVARRIVSPVKEISDVSRRLVAGETKLSIPMFARDDEIGAMSHSLAVLQSYAQGSVAKAEERASAQQERVARVELVQSLASKFEATIAAVAGEVAATSSQLQEAAHLMSGNAAQSSERVVNASNLLAETSRGVSSAAAASDEFVMSIGEISRQADSSAARAREANEVAQDADRTISALDEMAGKVSSVVELISQIAQRTNLLALNASIEAARGGEAGRGFAVVASEVKELAMQTARAIEDVENQIRQIQEGSGASAAALRKIASEIEELQKTSLSIASAVDQQSLSGQELARHVDLAARNTEGVSADMEEVSRLAVATGSAASRVLGSCQNLGTQSEELRRQVAEFLSHVRAA